MSTRSKVKQSMTKAAATAVPVPVVRQMAPADNVVNMLQIEKYFNEHILDQLTSIRRLSVILSTLLRNTRSTERESEEPLLYMITLAGPSGTGKTTTIKHLRHFLGMEKGFQYEQQYIEFHAAAATISGGDNHYESFDIVERMNSALESYDGGRTMPPYIMIFIDDYEHASYPFKLFLNTLLINGKYKSSQGAQFSLPRETALIIVCKCHYGAEDILDMEERCDDWAKHHITREMERAGYTIERRNHLLPYYPLDYHVLKKLLEQKLNAYLNNSHLLRRFGVEVLTSTPAMKETLIRHVLTRLDKRCGMHGGERMLKDKLDVFFETGIAVIDQMREKEERSPIVLDSLSFDTSLFSEILNKKLDQVTGGDLIRTIKENPVNKQYLTKCNPAMKGQVETLSMRYGEKPVCGLIMNITYLNISNHYDVNETTKLLKDKNKKLKACIMAINEAVEKKDAHQTIDTIIKNHRELLHESSDDSGDEPKRLLSAKEAIEPAQTNKRKNEEQQQSQSPKKAKLSHSSSTEEDEEENNEELEEMDIYFTSDEEEDQPLYSEDLSFSELFESEEDPYLESLMPKKRGRPLKTIEGFIRVQNGRKDMSYECLYCHHIISKLRYVKNHHCR